MASDFSFDIVSRVDMPEAKNAINQSMTEIGQRFDFKGSKSKITLDEKASTITIISDDLIKLKSVIDILQSKCFKRGIPIKNLSYGTVENAAGGLVRQVITIQQGIATEKAKEIVKEIKGMKMKVQASIQQDQLRVTGKKKDDLQAAMQACKTKNFDIDLQFVNFR